MPTRRTARGTRWSVPAGLAIIVFTGTALGQAAGSGDSSGDIDPIPVLIRALEDPNPWVRRSALNALDDIGDPRGAEPMRRLLDDTTDHVRRAAEAIAERRRVRSGIVLEAATGRRCSDPDPSELGRLSSELQDADARARVNAARELGRFCGPDAIDPLVGALEDRSKHVRQAAAHALGHTGEAGAMLPLAAARWDREGAVRQAVASALAELCDPRGVGPLVEMIHDPDAHVRQVAAAGLGRHGDRRSAWALRMLVLNDENAHVRQSATNALGLMFAPRGIAQLDAQRCAIP